MIAEQLQAAGILLTSAEATVMALGIHVDTGSLTFDHTTVRDAAALTWLMGQGASLRAIGEYVEPGLSSELQDLLSVALEQMQTETIRGYSIAWVLLPVEGHVVGLSNLASRLLTLTEMDALLLATQFCLGDCVEQRLTVIGRSRGDWVRMIWIWGRCCSPGVVGDIYGRHPCLCGWTSQKRRFSRLSIASGSRFPIPPLQGK